MDPGLSQSKSLPLNLATGRRHQVSISISGSYQSHLSSIGHVHRVRTTSEQISLGPIDPEQGHLHVLEGGLTEQRPRVGRLGLLKQLAADPATFLSDDLRRIRSGHVWRLRTLVTLYLCFCVVFMTVKIHAFAHDTLQVASPLYDDQPQKPVFLNPAEVDTSRHRPPLMNVSLSQRLSVAFRTLPPQAQLETFVLQVRPSHASDLTACLWIEDGRLDEALASATTWPGPISLVVVTPYAPNTTGAAALRVRLARGVQSTGPGSRTTAHVLHVPSVAGVSTTVYLNMARFFARTTRVVLFPEGIPRMTGARARRWLDTLSAHVLHPVLLLPGNATHATTARTGTMAPPRVFVPAPVVITRDHPVWCAERGYLFGSRVLDWEDCMWKLWLESAGEASAVGVPMLWDGAARNASGPLAPSYAMKLRLRWSAKYRSEACAFALKRSQALESLSRTEKRHMQWRKKFCRETVGPGALDVS